jgi:hypothetical protein
MPAKFDRCVRGVKKRSKGRVNAYAVCTAAGTRRGNPSKVRIIHDYSPRLGVFNGKVYLIDENSETINGIPLKVQGTYGDHEVAYSSQLEWNRAYAGKVGDTTIIQVPWAGGRKEFAVYNTDRYQKLEDKEQPKAKVVKPKKADTYKGFFIAKDSHGYLAADEQRNLVRGEETFTGSTKGSIHKQVDNWLELQEEIKRGPGTRGNPIGTVRYGLFASEAEANKAANYVNKQAGFVPMPTPVTGGYELIIPASKVSLVEGILKRMKKNPGYGRHLDDNYAPITLYRYFTTKQAAQSYLRLNSWPGGVESKRGGWPGSRDWVAGEEFRVKVPDGGTRLIGRQGNPVDLETYAPFTARFARYERENGFESGVADALRGTPMKSRADMVNSMPTTITSVEALKKAAPGLELDLEETVQGFIDHRYTYYKMGYESVTVIESTASSKKEAERTASSLKSNGYTIRGIEKRGPYEFVVVAATGKRLRELPYGARRKGNPDRLTAKKFYEFGTTRGTQDRQSSSVGLSVDPDVQSRSGFSFIWDRALSNGEVLKKDEQKYRQQFFDGYYNAYSNLGKRYRRRNPESGAESMYESFHGAPSEEVLEFREDEHYHGNLAGLGVLVELKLVTTTGYDVTLTFSDPEALIASNPETSDPIYTDLGYGSLYQKRKGKTWWVRPSHRDSRFTPGKGPDGSKFGDWQKVGETLGPDRALASGKLVPYQGNPGIWDRLKRIGSKSTVYHVPKHSERMTKATVYQGREIFKTQEGDYRVPSLERESSFDSLADAKKFVGAWKGNPAPKGQSEAFKAGYRYYHSRLKSSKGAFSVQSGAEKYAEKFGVRTMSGAYQNEATRARIKAAQDAYDQFLDGTVYAHDERLKAQHPDSEENPGPFQSASQLIGSTGKYLDNQLGRVLNKRNPVSLDPALLCSNEDGTQLYVQGGDQSVDLKSIHMADVPVKDSMVLGEAYFVSYFTEKDFDDHQPTIYEHDLAEESDPPKPKYRKGEVHTAANRPGLGQGSGCYPTVRYDVLNQRVYLDGGDYEIKKPLMGTSPGIEN